MRGRGYTSYRFSINRWERTVITVKRRVDLSACTPPFNVLPLPYASVFFLFYFLRFFSRAIFGPLYARTRCRDIRSVVSCFLHFVSRGNTWPRLNRDRLSVSICISVHAFTVDSDLESFEIRSVSITALVDRDRYDSLKASTITLTWRR